MREGRGKGKLPSLQTSQGKETALAAGPWFVDHRRRFFGQDVLELVPEDDVIQRRWLPGYGEALQSARDALAVLAGREASVRELYLAAKEHGETSLPFRETLVLILAAYDGASHARLLPDLLRELETPEQRSAFVQKLSYREKNAAKKQLPSLPFNSHGTGNPLPMPWGDVKPLWFALVIGWIKTGFWFASDEDIASMLQCPKGAPQILQPFRGSTGDVATGENVQRIRTELGLIRYPQKGRRRFENNSLVADETLKSEGAAAIRAERDRVKAGS